MNRNVEDIHDMMDDITEQNEIADEMGNIFSQPIGFGEMDEVSENYGSWGYSETEHCGPFFPC